METYRRYLLPLLLLLVVMFGTLPVGAAISVQCQGDLDGDAIPDPVYTAETIPDPNPDGILVGDPNPDFDPNVKCMHLSSGDGYITMGDGRPMYMFGFSDVTGIPADNVFIDGQLSHEFPAPPIALREGDVFWLTLSNVGMVDRPDLFDPHTVHYHGFPQSSNIYDGLPESGLSIKMGASLTYYYLNNDPGTYMYHCHVEATEHMQMGMLGSLYVDPIQNQTGFGGDPNTIAGKEGGPGPTGYVYNDGDGSTAYDVEFALQLGGFDSAFHDASVNTQPLPFALMKADYPMINGRGYPDTVAPVGPPAPPEARPLDGFSTQKVNALIEAAAGDRVLLRLSNLEVTRYFTLGSPGIPMRVVGKDAKLLRGPDGIDLSYTTHSLTFGGGMSYDVILDTTGMSGTHFLYATDLNFLVNGETDDGIGGMLTEIRIAPAP